MIDTETLMTDGDVETAWGGPMTQLDRDRARRVAQMAIVAYLASTDHQNPIAEELRRLGEIIKAAPGYGKLR